MVFWKGPTIWRSWDDDKLYGELRNKEKMLEGEEICSLRRDIYRAL